MLSRRNTVCLVISVITASLGTAVRAETFVEPEPIRLDQTPLWFADDGAIYAKSGVVRTIHVAQTTERPILEPERPWEGERIYVYGSVHPDLEGGGWRMWYQGVEGVQGPSRLLMAHSKDGIAWTRPNLGMVEHESSTETNIIRNANYPNVIIDKFEADPAKRYKMIATSGPKKYATYHSPDGLNWTAYPNRPKITGDDTLTLTQNPTTGEFLLYYKVNPEVRGKKRRSVALARSNDFVEWKVVGPVLTADEEDDSWVTDDVQNTQFYNMSVYPHAGGFVGLTTVFRVMRIGERAPGQSSHDGPIDVQMTTSTDGVTWRRTWPRTNVIPRGAPGTFAGGAILAVTNTLQSTDDEMFVYYTGLTTGHGGPVGPKRLSLGRAAWRRDGFVSLDADPTGGRIETQPMLLTNSTLVVNAHAWRGELRVALVEANGAPIPGYTLEDSDILRRDWKNWYVSWKDSAEVPTDRPVRVVVEMHSARLYALSTVALTEDGTPKQ